MKEKVWEPKAMTSWFTLVFVDGVHGCLSLVKDCRMSHDFSHLPALVALKDCAAGFRAMFAFCFERFMGPFFPNSQGALN